MRHSEWLTKIGLTTVAMAIFGCAVAFAQATTELPTLHVGGDVWLVIAGGLVTVGANFEQLRRARIDVRELRNSFSNLKDTAATAERMAGAAVRDVELRLARLEEDMDVLLERRRPLRHGRHRLATPEGDR